MANKNKKNSKNIGNTKSSNKKNTNSTNKKTTNTRYNSTKKNTNSTSRVKKEFEFGNLDLTSTLDTSFTSKKGSNKIADENSDKFKYIEDNIVITKKNTAIIYILLFIIILLVGFIFFHFFTFNHNKVKTVNKIKEKVIVDKNYLFLGDSITEQYNLNKYYKNKFVVNSGASGDTTERILKDLDARVYKYNPSKVFILIGINDIGNGVSEDKIINNIEKIISGIKKNRPYAKVYLESIYPVDEDRKNKKIKSINSRLDKYCSSNKVQYIDLYSKLIGNDGNIKDIYSDDGLHLTDEGYKVVTNNIKKYLD